MLVRAARRKSHLENIRARLLSCEQLQLPWLCPAYNIPFRDSRRWVTTETKPKGPGLTKMRNPRDFGSSRRALATAVGSGSLDDIPFESIGNMHSAVSSRAAGGFGSLVEGELPPLYFDSSLATSAIRHRTSAQGVGGDMAEMSSVLDACLRVGRFERAGVIIRRIAKTNIDPNELLELHNLYLRCAIEQVILNPSESARQDIHKWFELEIAQNFLTPTAETIAYMVKASLHSDAKKRERLVRRYMDMVPHETGYQVLCMDILTAEEINSVAHICPNYSITEDPDFVETSEQERINTPAESKSEPRLLSPTVRPTEQKGLGLKALKQSLSLFSTLPQLKIDMSKATLEEKREIQTRLEEDAVDSAIDRWREESAHLLKMGLNTKLQTKSLGARMWKWQSVLEEHLKKEIASVNTAELSEKKTALELERCLYGPFLRLLPPSKLAAITILSVMTVLGVNGVDRGVTLSSAIMAIASNVEDESTFEILQRESKNAVWPNNNGGNDHLKTVDLLKRAQKVRQPGRASRMLNHQKLVSASSDEILPGQWPTAMRAKVGAFLMSSLIDTAKIPVELPVTLDVRPPPPQLQPAFLHSHQYKAGRRVGMVIANKALVLQLKREPVHSLLSKHLPMLVEPDSWTAFDKGGYLAHPSKVMRVKLGDKGQRYYAEAAIGLGDMDQVFKGLDVLGKTSWRINQPVFDVMLEAWNSGQAIASIPPETPTFTLPQEPSSSQDPLQRRKWIKEVKEIEHRRNGLHSLRCFQNFQLEIARALRNETFYFPHNIDFRGRAYPIPPYLNHMGADNCRGLLIFGNGKALGEGGLRWVKIHLSNVFGFDKASLSEREEFANKNMDKIYDSAMNPLNGNRWWLSAEDPWQCLATCMELRNAIESGDPTTFISSLPVHQDGTCNGLQHYAALGGDAWGAKQVNLEPGDRPADVYTAVADLVKESITRDKAAGHPLAMVLDGKVTRKTVKQTVMTNVYGVTYIGAKAQVRKQLVAAEHDIEMTDTVNLHTLSAYIATNIFTALSTMFKGAHDIQYWLGECANRISMCLTTEQLERMELELNNGPVAQPRTMKDKAAGAALDEMMQFKSSVIWTTPLRLPIVQPYRKAKTKLVTTHMQGISLSDPHQSNPVSKRKQLQGFPPNFIHSLDATHMLLSALECDERGLTFAAVHDSFWTHAADVPTMSTALRNSFVRIHSDDVIGRLAAEFKTRHKKSMYLANIRSDSPVYKKIRQWRTSQVDSDRIGGMFKKSVLKVDELILERKRMALLSSADPEQVAKGKEMVTPTSIFQAMAAEQDLASDGLLAATGLGDISTNESKLDIETEIEDFDAVNAKSATNPAEGDVAGELESLDDAEDSRNFFEKAMDGQVTRYQPALSQVWLPLTIPPVPKKGAFDVSRLLESDYFFS